MPCMSYDNSWDSGDDDRKKIRELKKQADKLARIACKALAELEKNEQEDFLLLKDDEVREWWNAHKEADRREQARLAEVDRKARIKAEALARLSDEEKELLGLAQPKKPKSMTAGKARSSSAKQISGVGSPANPLVIDIEELFRQYNQDVHDRWVDESEHTDDWRGHDRLDK